MGQKEAVTRGGRLWPLSFLEPHVKEGPTTSNCSFDINSQDCTIESPAPCGVAG